MNKKTWIMPIAGNGTRTQQLGEYKPFIEINGKKIIEWFLISILDKIELQDNFIFITTKYFNDKFNIEITIEKLFAKYGLKNDVNVITTKETPQGPAKSVEYALDFIKASIPIIIINVDQFLLFTLPEDITDKCYLVSNIDTGTSKSYIELNNKNITLDCMDFNLFHSSIKEVFAEAFFKDKNLALAIIRFYYRYYKIIKDHIEIVNNYDYKSKEIFHIATIIGFGYNVKTLIEAKGVPFSYLGSNAFYDGYNKEMTDLDRYIYKILEEIKDEELNFKLINNHIISLTKYFKSPKYSTKAYYIENNGDDNTLSDKSSNYELEKTFNEILNLEVEKELIQGNITNVIKWLEAGIFDGNFESLEKMIDLFLKKEIVVDIDIIENYFKYMNKGSIQKSVSELKDKFYLKVADEKYNN